jgi:hypothetical protein
MKTFDEVLENVKKNVEKLAAGLSDSPISLRQHVYFQIGYLAGWADCCSSTPEIFETKLYEFRIWAESLIPKIS